MPDPITLLAKPRTEIGKTVSRLRRADLTPIVVYGHMTSPLALQVNTKELHRTLSAAGTSRLVALKIEGEKVVRMTLVRDVQRHVTRLNVIHADFMEVAMNETVRSEVPIEIVGEPLLVGRHEALLEHDITRVTVEALPADLPSTIVVDVSSLEQIGQSITVGDIVTGVNYEILHDRDTVIVRLQPLSRGGDTPEELAEAAAAAEEAEAAEPEVISPRRGQDSEA